MTALADQSARDAIRDALDLTLVVEAAAGTGKTTALVGRILSLLTTGRARLSQLVAVTFTEKAAGEMKLRLRAEIDAARRGAADVEQQRLDAALEELETAHIGTIHGFCAEILRARPLAARIDPLFVQLDDAGLERLYDEVFDRWFEAALASPGEGVRRALRRRGGGRFRQDPREELRGAGLRLVNQRDFDAPWRRAPFARDAEIDAVLFQLSALGALAGDALNPDDWCAKSFAELRRFVDDVARADALGRDVDGLEERLRGLSHHKLWGWRGKGKQYSATRTRDDVLAERDAAHRALEAFVARAEADLAACLSTELRGLVNAYEALKLRTGSLDFLDLLVRTRDLLRDDDTVRATLQQRWTHLLIDEFQDTDPLQAEILLLLAATDPDERDAARVRPVAGKLFLVGDPKQSIYRFRRADVKLYDDVKQRLVRDGARLLHLTTSFRSTPTLQGVVNDAFAPHMQGSVDGSQATYVALTRAREEHEAQPSVVALPVPEPFGFRGEVTKGAVQEREPTVVAAFIDWLVHESGWTTLEADGSRVPIQARHVCLLFRRMANSDITQSYVRALDARQLSHVLVGGKSFHAREEVQALRNVLAAIEHPDDELSVFAALRGPFFGLGDDALLAWRDRFSRLHPLLPPQEAEGLEPVAEVLALLGELHAARNQRPFADTLGRVLDAVRAHAGIAIWTGGEQALANLLRVVDTARRFEASGGPSFRALVERLEREASRGSTSEAPILEDGADGVRLMTAHRAKGLEFPVVILADIVCPKTHKHPSMVVDSSRKLWASALAGCAPVELLEGEETALRHDDEEATRLAYVAATRARDLLVLPVVAEEQMTGWVDVLNAPLAARDSTAHEEGRIVWFDTDLLDLEKHLEVGQRHQKVLAADPSNEVARLSIEAHAQWRAARAARIERARAPLVVVEAITARSARAELDVDVPSARTTEAARTPRGTRFGVLVHAVLATVPLDANDEAIARATEALARTTGSSEEEISAATRAVTCALRHAWHDEARAALAVRRNAPVVLRDDDGTVLEGKIDLAYRTDAGWVVVDYKTDVDGAPRYARQVQLYARAIAEATGRPARGALLFV